ncbi:hypothetical protein [Chlamydiifrater volucris]|uniref:hypothetical protein n=1 Tax=Chlamydiifrater volucris TaxID=2681470 RepID=UPI001BD0AB40|nr:hypothetical protein [Chlamydiifrater volucris]
MSFVSDRQEFLSPLSEIEGQLRKVRDTGDYLEKKVEILTKVRNIFLVCVATSLRLVLSCVFFFGINVLILELLLPEAFVIAVAASAFFLVSLLSFSCAAGFRLRFLRRLTDARELELSELKRLETKKWEIAEKTAEEKRQAERVAKEAENARRELIRESFLTSPYLKKESKRGITDIVLQERYISPELVSDVIEQSFDICFAQRKLEALHEEKGDIAVSGRSKRELSFILLGFLSLEELKEISRIYEEESRKGVKNPSAVYAKCIEKYPQIVAAEAAYFSWLRHSFSYLSKADASIFKKSSVYRTEFFSVIKDFWGQTKACSTLLLLEKFSGWLPAVLSVFQEDRSKGVSVCPKGVQWDWDSLCRKASDYFRYTLLHGESFGNANDLLDFTEKGSGSRKFRERRLQLKIRCSDQDFLSNPKPLWDLRSFCSKKSELSTKIEEGLAFLNDCGYLGEENVADLQDFERTILGLKK